MNSLNISDLALHFGAQQKTSELTAFIDFIRPLALRTVVEIGTKKGGTLLVWMLLASHDAKIISIDLPFGPFGGGDFTNELNAVLAFRRPAQQVMFIRADSHQPQTKDELVRILQGRAIDLMFIDGDHSYAGVKCDYEMYSPLVAPGGIVVFHDVLPHPGFPGVGVNRFWKELTEGRQFRTFLDPEHNIGYGMWGGIGVVAEPGPQPVNVAQR